MFVIIGLAAMFGILGSELRKEEYDNWRYNYPKFDATGEWVKIPSQELSKALLKSLKYK